MTDSRIPVLDKEKRTLLDALLAREGLDVDGPGTIPRRTTYERAPLSFAQQRLWFISQFDPASAAYNVPLTVPFPGALQINALEKTLNEVVRRHEILRTRFEFDQGEPVQCIAKNATVALTVVDLSARSKQQQRESARLLAADEAALPFDLMNYPLLRACLLRFAPDDHILLLTLHHIVTDAWSMDVLAREMTTLYTAFASSQRPTLPELSIQYADFAVWQRQSLQGEHLQAQLDYWRTRLAGASLLELPTDRPRPPVATSRGAECRHSFPESLVDPLRTLAHTENVTLFMLLLALFKTLLHRYSGQEDILVGSPIAGRITTELEPLIGFFVNSLVLRTTFAGNPTFQEVLQRVRETALGAYAYQELPFEKLVEELHPERDLSRNPLFQVIFQVLRGAAEGSPPPAAIDVGIISAKFDLSFTVQDRGGALDVFVEYNADLYDADTVEQMCVHYVNLARAFVEAPDTRISNAMLLSTDELYRHQVTFNATAAHYPTDTNLHTLIEHAAKSQPTAIAVQSEDGSLCYQELDARANRLARRLIELGVGPDRIVGIHLERSLDMVVAIFATLKAGGAYLPLSPDYPSKRLTGMLEDSDATVVITNEALALSAVKGSAILFDLDRERERIACESDAPLDITTDAEHLAYVIYTSGSTGRPKGVMVPHRAVCNHMHWMISHYAFTSRDAVLQKTPINFDASVWEIFAPLISGGRLVLARQGGHRDSAYLVRAVSENKVSILQLVPSQLRLILEEPGLAFCEALRLVFSGGEPLTADLCVRFRQKLEAELHNIYGPTEVTIDSTSWPCHTIGPADRVPIGKPIDNLQAYVLDKYLNLLPRGVPGVLYLGGAGVARGYLGQPQLTAERFIPDPFSSQTGGRLYCTGDRVRQRRDGSLEYLGRIDQQVKLRGYRIEPAEIVHTLESHPAVQQAVATVRAGTDGEERLGAYVVLSTQAPCPTDELRAHLHQLLPDYMIPAWISVLSELPLTPHGKIDWQALPDPESDAPPPRSVPFSPEQPMELRVAALWAEVLGVREVGPDDNFFDHGGHSLLMIQVQHRLREDLSVDLELLDLFRYPSVRLLCTHLAGRKTSDHSPTMDPAKSVTNGSSRPAPQRPSMQSRPMFRRPSS
jgi:amino acid adenylation domain-containing protein